MKARAIVAMLVLATASALAAAACVAEQSAESEAWIASTAEAHALADRARAAGDLGTATQILERALRAEPPSAIAPSDLSGIRRDLHYRLSELARERGDGAEALRWADQGLKLGRAPDLFEVNLLVARGSAHEALGAGPLAAADYHDAMKISETLLQATLSPLEKAR